MTMYDKSLCSFALYYILNEGFLTVHDCSLGLVFDMHDNAYATIPGYTYNCSSVASV